MYWDESINVSHLHRLYSAGEINVVQLAKGLVGRLKTTKYYSIAEPDFINIIMELNSIDALSSHEDYRIALDYLYDFGDKEHRLWIETEKDTAKEDIEEDKKATNIKVKMLDDYRSGSTDEFLSVLKGPYYGSATEIIKATPAAPNSSFTSCATSSARYNRHRPVRFLSEYDFEKRLKAKGIDPKVLSREFSIYIRDANDDYQAWLMDRYLENGGKSVEPKKAPMPRVRSGERNITR